MRRYGDELEYEQFLKAEIYSSLFLMKEIVCFISGTYSSCNEYSQIEKHCYKSYPHEGYNIHFFLKVRC